MDNIRSTIIKSQPNPPAAPEAVDDDDPLGQLVAKSFVLADIVYEPLDHVQTTFGTAGYSDVERFECRRFGVQAIGCRQGDVAHLVIRGSDETVDWLLDIYAVPSFRPLHHRGFGLCWRRIEAPVRAWLDRLGGGGRRPGGGPGPGPGALGVGLGAARKAKGPAKIVPSTVPSVAMFSVSHSSHHSR